MTPLWNCVSSAPSRICKSELARNGAVRNDAVRNDAVTPTGGEPTTSANLKVRWAWALEADFQEVPIRGEIVNDFP